MRLKIIFSNPEKQTEVPINYQRILQGVIYHLLETDQEFQHFIHEIGYAYENRRFKAFTFSRLFGKSEFNPQRRSLTFKGPITWYISSAIPKFIHLLGQSFLLRDQIRLHQTDVTVKQLQYEQVAPIYSEKIRIKMLSPVTVYSTFVGDNGKKITQYFDPDDLAFSHLIEENAKKKYEAFFKKPFEGQLKIKPLKVSPKDKVITKYKDTIINGWNGIYELEGPKDMLEFLYNTALGSKNSQGFGMFGVLNKNENTN
ncbi:CRISPR-associated endoribonuclease Cas6 [Fervidibacillus halotolerans]|uniref:CRISPR-associated endoribonuclease n=1 Tax=Fervidibacillus halotolerans TaxID=2980027 RepID=A0A9E8LYY7_9BACI|nr:CRISPR-associated endoribonuclease Cas6 [Fervidibacillus halotolerans]WAA11992.1 CRISPR-associated endoribonuclease Cas6 [Fervidibacillus halotolerans]